MQVLMNALLRLNVSIVRSKSFYAYEPDWNCTPQ